MFQGHSQTWTQPNVVCTLPIKIEKAQYTLIKQSNNLLKKSTGLTVPNELISLVTPHSYTTFAVQQSVSSNFNVDIMIHIVIDLKYSCIARPLFSIFLCGGRKKGLGTLP